MDRSPGPRTAQLRQLGTLIAACFLISPGKIFQVFLILHSPTIIPQ